MAGVARSVGILRRTTGEHAHSFQALAQQVTRLWYRRHVIRRDAQFQRELEQGILSLDFDAPQSEQVIGRMALPPTRGAGRRVPRVGDRVAIASL
jgi:hypothetical protein